MRPQRETRLRAEEADKQQRKAEEAATANLAKAESSKTQATGATKSNTLQDPAGDAPALSERADNDKRLAHPAAAAAGGAPRLDAGQQSLATEAARIAEDALQKLRSSSERKNATVREQIRLLAPAVVHVLSHVPQQVRARVSCTFCLCRVPPACGPAHTHPTDKKVWRRGSVERGKEGVHSGTSPTDFKEAGARFCPRR